MQPPCRMHIVRARVSLSLLSLLSPPSRGIGFDGNAGESCCEASRPDQKTASFDAGTLPHSDSRTVSCVALFSNRVLPAARRRSIHRCDDWLSSSQIPILQYFKPGPSHCLWTSSLDRLLQPLTSFHIPTAATRPSASSDNSSATMTFLSSPARRMACAAPLISSRTFSTTRPASLARLTLVGRLGADPEITETGKGQVIRYVVGTGHGPRDNRQTSWFRVASFAPEGPQRDLVMGLSKG